MRLYLTPQGTFIGQIGDPRVDHNYWGRPEEQDLKARRAHYTWNGTMPASDLKSSAAAALASSALALNATDPDLARRCVVHARQLFASAARTEGKYSSSFRAATSVYASGSFLVSSSGLVAVPLAVPVDPWRCQLILGAVPIFPSAPERGLSTT